MSINVESEGKRASFPNGTLASADADVDGSASLSDSEKARLPLHKRKDIRQFVKFCIVGSSSFAVNFILFNLLYYHVRIFSLVAATTISFFISVINGFVLNRNWTFKEARGASVANQSTKFMLVNIVGWFLNTGITVGLIAAWLIMSQHSQVHFSQIFWDIISGKKEHYGKLVTNCSLLAATGVVVFWNFFANRHWTFKH